MTARPAARSGQKCSAQSMLFVHENWVKAGILERLERLAARRKLDDLTVRTPRPLPLPPTLRSAEGLGRVARRRLQFFCVHVLCADTLGAAWCC